MAISSLTLKFLTLLAFLYYLVKQSPIQAPVVPVSLVIKLILAEPEDTSGRAATVKLDFAAN